MKSLLLLASFTVASFTVASVAGAADTTQGIVPSADMNLYAAVGPEPSHALFLMMGVFGLVLRRRR